MSGVIKNSRLLARRLAVAALGLWLCGAGCVMCCAPPEAKAQTQTLAPTSAHALSSKEVASAPSHCTARGSHSEAVGDFGLAATQARTSSSENEYADKCCERNGLTSVPARKQYPANERGGNNSRADFSWTDGDAHEISRPAARGRSPDAHATHLRCCVFLI